MPVLSAGAKGYMLKTSSADELLHAVRKVAAGELAIEQERSARRLNTTAIIWNFAKLTARERDVLQLIAKGYEISGSQMNSYLSQDGQDPCPISCQA